MMQTIEHELNMLGSMACEDTCGKHIVRIVANIFVHTPYIVGVTLGVKLECNETNIESWICFAIHSQK